MWEAEQGKRGIGLKRGETSVGTNYKGHYVMVDDVFFFFKQKTAYEILA